jgi:hypothetical protein
MITGSTVLTHEEALSCKICVLYSARHPKPITGQGFHQSQDIELAGDSAAEQPSEESGRIGIVCRFLRVCWLFSGLTVFCWPVKKFVY